MVGVQDQRNLIVAGNEILTVTLVRRRWRCLIGVALFFVLPGCGLVDGMEDNLVTGDANVQEYHMMNEGFRLSEDEVLRLHREAASGSGEAANKLAIYYEYYMGDSAVSLDWYQISAENGYFLGMYNYAKRIEMYTDPKKEHSDAEIRARFWYKKVIEGGPDDLAKKASEALKRLGENEKVMPFLDKSTRP